MYSFIILFLNLAANSYQNNSSKTEVRIYRGYEASIYTFSYVGFLHFDIISPSTCTSSLFMVQAVLTAAHCMREMKMKNGRIVAYFGAEVPRDSKVKRKVVSYTIHPKYNYMKGKNNIAVAFLDKRVPLSRTITKIPLASSPTNAGTVAWAIGWGKQNIKIPSKLPDYSQNRAMKGTTQTVLKNKVCSGVAGFKPSLLWMCTKSRVGQFYKDDAGSGLVVPQPTQNLIGIFSHTVGGYAYFSNVYANRDWIISATKSLYIKYCQKKTLVCRNVMIDDDHFAGNCSVQNEYIIS